MSLQRIRESMPYLKDITELYLKVREFDAVPLSHPYGSVTDRQVCYVGQDIETVVNEFARVFDLSPEASASIKEALRTGEIDFTLLPQMESESSAVSFAPEGLSEDVVSFLYILGRPFFKSVKRSLDVDHIYWEGGRCPVCNALPALSVLERNEFRRYHCSFCGTMGHYKRIGCPRCHNENPEQMDIMYAQVDERMRVDACTQCQSYVKTVDASLLAEHDPEELDLMSLPLDIIAQNKGFHRRSPNPVGIVRIR